MDLSEIAAEVRRLASPRAVLCHPHARREALLSLARRIEYATLTPQAAKRRETKRVRLIEKSDPWAELRRVLANEQAEI